jgi:hypothetical protein
VARPDSRCRDGDARQDRRDRGRRGQRDKDVPAPGAPGAACQAAWSRLVRAALAGSGERTDGLYGLGVGAEGLDEAVPLLIPNVAAMSASVRSR